MMVPRNSKRRRRHPLGFFVAGVLACASLLVACDSDPRGSPPGDREDAPEEAAALEDAEPAEPEPGREPDPEPEYLRLDITEVRDPDSGVPVSNARVIIEGDTFFWESDTVVTFEERVPAGRAFEVLSVRVEAEGYGANTRQVPIFSDRPTSEILELGARLVAEEDEEPDEEQPVEEPEDEPDEELDEEAEEAPEPPADVRTVRVEVEPSGARVVLRDRENPEDAWEVESPGTIDVPPGFYSWESTLDGHLADRSSQDLDLASGDEAVIRATLPPVDVEEAIQRGDEAFEEGDFDEAVQHYQGVPEPSDLESTLGRQYLQVRNRLGQALVELGEPGAALEVFEEIAEADPREYTAHLQLGIVNRELGRCEEARRHLVEVQGRLLNNVPVDRRPEIQGIAMYYQARCSLDEFEATRDDTMRRRIGARAFSELSEFLNHVDRRVAEPSSFLESAITEAEAELERLREILG